MIRNYIILFGLLFTVGACTAKLTAEKIDTGVSVEGLSVNKNTQADKKYETLESEVNVA